MAHRRPGLPTTGPHVFVEPIGDRSTVTIDGQAGHHLASVLRVRADQAISLADDSGTVYQAQVVQSGRSSVDVVVLERFQIPPPAVRLSVAQGVPKGRKMDEIIQRLTEIGVDRIRPVVTERSIRQIRGEEKAERMAERWQGIARSAAEQSRRSRLPVIDPVGAWPLPDAVGVVLWEEATMPLGVAVSELPSGLAEVTVAVGPEGGLTAAEVASADGLVSCAVGASILRTETAGLVGAVLLGTYLGRYA